MYTRFKSGLFNPANLIKFVKDTYLMVFSYFAVLLILVSLPSLIKLNYNGLSSEEIQQIDTHFNNYLASNNEIVNNRLIVNNPNKRLELEIISIGFTDDIGILDNNFIEIILLEEGILYRAVSFHESFISYEELELTNFTFNNYSSENKTLFINAINKVISKNASFNNFILLTRILFGNVFEIVFLVLLSALFNNRLINFQTRFIIGVYASTIYAVLAFFAVIFSLNILNFIGIILMIFYSRRPFQIINKIRGGK